MITRPNPNHLDAVLHDRLLKFGQFIKTWGEWGLASFDVRPQCRGTYKFAVNAGTNLMRHAKADYKPAAAAKIRDYLEEERIKDMSLIIDELFDAENLTELLELVKANKKTEI